MRLPGEIRVGDIVIYSPCTGIGSGTKKYWDWHGFLESPHRQLAQVRKVTKKSGIIIDLMSMPGGSAGYNGKRGKVSTASKFVSEIRVRPEDVEVVLKRGGPPPVGWRCTGKDSGWER